MRTGIALFIIGLVLGACGLGAIVIYGPTGYQHQLDDARLALDTARARSGELERGIEDARRIADASATRVGEAVRSAAGIADRGQRIVTLVGAIKSVVGDLERLSTIGTESK